MGKQWPQKTIIGLTGNIATGKSAVMRMAEEAGALIIDADGVVHSLMDYDSNMQAAIGVAFGPQTRLADGRINRDVLGELVFKDAKALKDLEQMVHPAVRQEIAARIEQSDKTVVMIEAIKLLDGELKGLCDQVWVTRCPAQRQVERLVICRGMDAAAAKQRVDLQGPQETKIAQADVVFDTHGTLENTRKQFMLAWRRLFGVDPIMRRKLADPLVGPGAAMSPPAAASVASKPAPPATPPPTTSSAAAPVASKPAPPPASKPAAATTSGGAVSRPQPMARISPTTPQPSPEEINVRRARPSDVPAVLLHLHKATDGQLKMSRAELLMALGERSYFIAQAGTTISIVVGWHIENLIARVDQLHIWPSDAAATALDPVLKEIEKSAIQHFCEIIITFLPNAQVDALGGYLAYNEYEILNPDQLPRVWKQALQESQPADTLAMIKILREDRITAPI